MSRGSRRGGGGAAASAGGVDAFPARPESRQSRLETCTDPAPCSPRMDLEPRPERQTPRSTSRSSATCTAEFIEDKAFASFSRNSEFFSEFLQ